MEVFGTAYFPPIAYFQLLARSDNAIIDLGENFIKQTYRNRCYILGSNGKLPLIVPVSKTNIRTVQQIQISYHEEWPQKHLQAIRSAYRNAPFFEEFEGELEALLITRFNTLGELNKTILQWLLDGMELDVQVAYSGSYLDPKKNDLADYRSLKFYEEVSGVNIKPYKQVFSGKYNFTAGLSILDLLFNKGAETSAYILGK